MEKRKDIQIFCFGHKEVEYGMPDDALYTPLEVGAALREPVFNLRDNTGDNISAWNPLYAENTGTYWIWQNAEGYKFLGQCQYRRRLQFEEDFDFDALFERYDLVTTVPLFMTESVRAQYNSCHNSDDLDMCRQVVIDLYPDYRDAWEEYIENGRYLFYSNGYVMRSEDYRRYCEWLFSIFAEYRKRKLWDTVEDIREEISRDMLSEKRSSARGLSYQAQVFGFLSERLFTLWARKNFPTTRILIMQYVKMEDTAI